jgi:hypothetical protein
VVTTENPPGVAGTRRLSEPSLMPEPSLLSLVKVTVSVDGFVAVPPGAMTAGLLAVQPTCPLPHSTTEYGLLLFAGFDALAVAARATEKTKIATSPETLARVRTHRAM